MASIKELIQSIESGDSSFDEKLAAINQMEETLVAMREHEQEVIDENVELIIEALRTIEAKVEAKLRIIPEKGEQGLQGPKGEQGDRGLDGANGRDGRDGKDGRDGVDGQDGVGVTDAKIDFDGSLVITLSDGREINVGEVVPVDVAEKIRTVHNIQSGSGGDSQTVLDAIAALQATIATYGTMATQNANSVAITGGTINNTTIGATTPSTGVFTTLTATGQTSLGGVAGAEGLRVTSNPSATSWVEISGSAGGIPNIKAEATGASAELRLSSKSGSNVSIWTNNVAQRQFQVSHTASAVNYVQVTGGATTKGVIQSAQGSDSNISYVTQSKGTGAIDLAAGSSGVNISNGGTVTAITRTAAGSGYTSIPSVAISAPTTAGGVQSTATAIVQIRQTSGVTINNGGTGYTVGDTLTVVGGTGTAAQFTVATVSSGVITTITLASGGAYSTLPSFPASVTGGTGSSATFTFTDMSLSATPVTITNAGSGYVEQPTVTFSGGGGGSGAAAYATVGSIPTVKSIGSAISFATPSGEQFRVRDNNNTAVNYGTIKGSSSGSTVDFGVDGADGGITLALKSKGTGGIFMYTAGGNNAQFGIPHTASAVNYVQVTGAATGSRPAISAQGSDTNAGLNIQTKGTGSFFFVTGGSSIAQLVVTNTASSVNYINVTGGATGVAPVVSALGTDTNIDLALTPKGTGKVRFGTFTADMTLIVQGYIEVKDSGGTIRKLAVIA